MKRTKTKDGCMIYEELLPWGPPAFIKYGMGRTEDFLWREINHFGARRSFEEAEAIPLPMSSRELSIGE